MDNKLNRLIQGIDTVIFRVSSIDISKAWYQEKLGLTTTWEDPEQKLAVLDTYGPTSLTIWQTDKKLNIDRGSASFPIFRTPDAAALKKELESRGLKVNDLVSDAHVSYFMFSDPDGNILEACQVL